jgi:ribonucleotide reductase alpha subunit
MKVFNDATEAVKQCGTRRGANKVIPTSRPSDIETSSAATGYARKHTSTFPSVSPSVFMQRWSGQDYALINPRQKNVVKPFRARVLK